MGTDLSDLSPTRQVFPRYRLGGTLAHGAPIVHEVIRECLAANPRMQCAAAQDAEFHAAMSTLRQALAHVDQALAAEDLPEETRRRVAARVVAAGLDRCRVEQPRDLMARLGIATL